MHDKVKSQSRRAIPAVSTVLDSLGQTELPRPLVVDIVRSELSQIRRSKQVPDLTGIVGRIRRALEKLRVSRMQPVINGTGVTPPSAKESVAWKAFTRLQSSGGYVNTGNNAHDFTYKTVVS